MSELDAEQGGHLVSKSHALVTRRYLLAFILVTSLFFMWAVANNFNDILIKHFQKALDLTRMQSGFVQTAFYFGYFTIALPAGWVMSRWGYKAGIIIGLVLYGCGAALFFPAAEVREYGVFLAALYIIAAGLAFLETAANPYVSAMGPPQTAAQRLNLAQSFNGFGAVIAPVLGGALILSGVEYSSAELALLAPDAIEQYRASEARAVQLPYLVLAAVVLSLAVIIYLTPFPSIEGEAEAEPREPGQFGFLLRRKRLRAAVFAQFLYVGAQVGIWSYFINFAQEVVEVGEKTAANYLAVSLACFMVGRFLGTALMSVVKPEWLLAIFGFAAGSLCILAILFDGYPALFALGTTGLFMSIMFPTIFAIGIADLGTKAKLASSLLIMAIVGGAILPPLMGLVADMTGSIQLSMILPAACFAAVAMFAWRYRSTFSTKELPL